MFVKRPGLRRIWEDNIKMDVTKIEVGGIGSVLC
jgi:hypothetical protein